MLEEVKYIQDKAINEMLTCVFEEQIDNITFKAPTGSGKTFMMARFMDKFLAQDHNVIFVVSSLSKCKLAQQNYTKFIEYREHGFVKNLNTYLINSETSGENSLFIPTDYNVYVLPRDLYKKNSKLKDQGAFKIFLTELKRKKYQIILIKDECHIATSNLDDLLNDDEKGVRKYFSKVINISATPKEKPDIELFEHDAINAKLIKSVEYRSSNKETYTNFEVDSPQYGLLEGALKEFLKLKKKYLELNINPCFIIQISNKDEGEEQFQVIKQLLNSPVFSNLKWMSVAHEAKFNETNDDLMKGNKENWDKYVVQNESLIDIIIFKLKISEGWDIPRACMLFQIRDSKSKQLDEQVLGRIRRNPKLLQFEKLSQEHQDLVTKAYVWGIRPDDRKNKLVDVQLRDLSQYDNPLDTTLVQDEIKLKITKLKDELKEIDQKFDIESLLSNSDESSNLANKSIFDLYGDLIKSNNKIQNECWHYVENHSVEKASKYFDWFSFTSNIDLIQNKIRTTLQSYESSIEIVKDSNNNDVEVSFPENSVYLKNDFKLGINNWIWINDDKYSEFSFDSEAEKEWIYKLKEECKNKIKKINDILLVGKNFLPNSEIRYQYYDNGMHYSYPDFVLKSKNDEIFIFEVKSLNKSSKLQIDDDQYRDKIQKLTEFYKHVSKILPTYHFCFPIKRGNDWTIHHSKNGDFEILGWSDFIKYLD